MRTLLVVLAFLSAAVATATASGPSTTIAVGGAPTGIAFGRGSAWVALVVHVVCCALGITARGRLLLQSTVTRVPLTSKG